MSKEFSLSAVDSEVFVFCCQEAIESYDIDLASELEVVAFESKDISWQALAACVKRVVSTESDLPEDMFIRMEGYADNILSKNHFVIKKQ